MKRLKNILIGLILMLSTSSCGTMHVVEGPPPDHYMYHYHYYNYWPRPYHRPPVIIQAPPPKPQQHRPNNRPTNRGRK